MGTPGGPSGNKNLPPLTCSQPAVLAERHLELRIFPSSSIPTVHFFARALIPKLFVLLLHPDMSSVHSGVVSQLCLLSDLERMYSYLHTPYLPHRLILPRTYRNPAGMLTPHHHFINKVTMPFPLHGFLQNTT